MVRTLLLCALATSAACSFGDDRRLGSGDAGPDGMTDGPPGPKDHILLSEIKIEGGDTEFIEIWNPTNRSIDLSNYYLTDIGEYWKWPAAVRPTVSTSDFVVRFPAGATIAARQVITVSMDKTLFSEAYGITATYSLDVATGAQAFRDRTVPGPVGDASLTDGGEIVVLFYWDGMSDLVKDVDIVLAGKTAAAGNSLKAKEAVDGPDTDAIPSAYQPDNGLLGGGMSDLAGESLSFKRRTLEVGAESQLGSGNGITGDDETSEALKSSWDGDAASPFTAPTPGIAPNI
jgi:Lamin Tail Domain